MLNTLTDVDQNDYSKNVFIGTVVYNEDPLELRRVKVQIPNLLEGPQEQLPWIAPMFLGFVPNVPGNSGSANLVPGIGAELAIEFQMGSLLHGLYVASPLRPGSKLSEFGGANYLRKYGWKDPAGNIFIVDTTPGQNTIRVFHASGTELKIENNGKMTTTVVNDNVVTVQGNTTVNTQGTTSIHSTGDVTVSSSSHVQVTAPIIDLN